MLESLASRASVNHNILYCILPDTYVQEMHHVQGTATQHNTKDQHAHHTQLLSFNTTSGRMQTASSNVNKLMCFCHITDTPVQSWACNIVQTAPGTVKCKQHKSQSH
jgi:hypothetical protein